MSVPNLIGNFQGTHSIIESLDMNNFLITNLPLPGVNSDVANKQYVDNIIGGSIQFLTPDATVASRPFFETFNAYTYSGSPDFTLTLASSTLSTVDSVSVSVGNYILIKDRSDSTTNGLYIITATGSPDVILTRASTFDENAELLNGTISNVLNGSVNDNTKWILTSPNPITLDVDDIIFEELTSNADINAGDNLTLVGNTVNLDSEIFLDGIGIGTTTLATDAVFHIQSTSNDIPANIFLEADTGNDVEADQPSITLTQDGNQIGMQLGAFSSSNNVRIDSLHSVATVPELGVNLEFGTARIDPGSVATGQIPTILDRQNELTIRRDRVEIDNVLYVNDVEPFSGTTINLNNADSNTGAVIGNDGRMVIGDDTLSAGVTMRVANSSDEPVLWVESSAAGAGHDPKAIFSSTLGADGARIYLDTSGPIFEFDTNGFYRFRTDMGISGNGTAGTLPSYTNGTIRMVISDNDIIGTVPSSFGDFIEPASVLDGTVTLRTGGSNPILWIESTASVISVDSPAIIMTADLGGSTGRILVNDNGDNLQIDTTDNIEFKTGMIVAGTGTAGTLPTITPGTTRMTINDTNIVFAIPPEIPVEQIQVRRINSGYVYNSANNPGPIFQRIDNWDIHSPTGTWMDANGFFDLSDPGVYHIRTTVVYDPESNAGSVSTSFNLRFNYLTGLILDTTITNVDAAYTIAESTTISVSGANGLSFSATLNATITLTTTQISNFEGQFFLQGCARSNDASPQGNILARGVGGPTVDSNRSTTVIYYWPMNI